MIQIPAYVPTVPVPVRSRDHAFSSVIGLNTLRAFPAAVQA